MRISHGPRGQSGVTSIMGLGDDIEIVTPSIVEMSSQQRSLVALDRTSQIGLALTAGSWLVLYLVGLRRPAKVAGVAALTLFAIRKLSRHYRET